MKVVCTQENLSSGLQVVSHIASKNISLPILNNVLLKATSGTLSLMTTNLEMGVSCQIRGRVEKDGSFTVQAKTLSDYIGLLDKENITLELNEQNLRIESKNSKTLMKGVESSEFPLIPKVEPTHTCVISAKALKEALSSVSFAVSFDETRPEINGVFFNFEGEKLTLATTDSYRLVEKQLKLKQSAPNHKMIIPIKTIQELIRIIGEVDDLTINSNENQVLFIVGEISLTSRLIEGQYPDYQQIIPKEHKTKINLETKSFANTVKRASLFCKTGSNDVMLRFLPSSGEVVVSANNLQVGESEAKQPSEIEGEENNIVFNSRFLLDGLQNIGDEDCVLEINTNATPGLLKPKSRQDYLYIIMPIKQ